MKLVKYLLVCAFAFCAITSNTKAQTVQFLGTGSSAIFNQLGNAVAPSAGFSDANGAVNCFWSYKTTAPGTTPYIAANDGRTGVNLDENGNIFVAWGPGGTGGTCAAPVAPFSIYSYMSLDSVVGDRCFFINDNAGHGTGCKLIMTSVAGTSGQNAVSLVTDNTAIPGSIVTALTGNQRVFVAGTDVRPEDARFQIMRAFVPCNQYMPRQYFNNDSFYTFGLGYGTAGTHIGTAIGGNPSYGGGSFNVVDFGITGNDPISGAPVPASYTASTIGAQPMLFVVSPTTDGYVRQLRDITTFTLSQLLQGSLAKTNDLLYMDPTQQAAGEGLNVFIREWLSGTYNTVEYSNPNGTQYHGSQEALNCSGGTPATNPMLFTVSNGASTHTRVIGTGNTLTALNGAASGSPWFGYFFHSAGNDAKVTHGKYLTVNGVDPILNSWNGGVLPGSGNSYTVNGTTYTDPGIAAVTFAGLNAGDYPIWSAIRLVSASPVPTGVANMLNALNALTVLQNDFIKPNSMNIWHSHFFLNGQSLPNPSNGATVGTQTLCSGGLPESGGDVGGETMLIINNAHFCTDFSSTQGKLNLTQ